jgi:hypothetical protein
MAEDKPKRKKFIPPKIPHKELRADQKPIYGVAMAHERLVGRVVIECSRLEAVLNDLLWKLLGVSFEDGRVITGRRMLLTKLAYSELLRLDI